MNKPVNLTLNPEIVSRAKALVGARNLSATVDGLLETYVREHEAKQSDRKAQVAQWCAASDAFVAEHGLPLAKYRQF